ncbi:hypothetical protein [Leisingera sp. ANG-M7]|uniref:hypothetical protein n=1 Tax=Leisingera sp. ANG-M7 TaxID=1577902 RepID=UPI0005803284|nr:hypothetical protein [Leisingera sp. ANG-M7]KIC35747.1 hypothetical protein RA26_15730 [Leisingera sp. ANG-M7]
MKGFPHKRIHPSGERVHHFAAKLKTGEFVSIHVINTTLPLEVVEFGFPKNQPCFHVYFNPETGQAAFSSLYDDELHEKVQKYVDANICELIAQSHN